MDLKDTVVVLISDFNYFSKVKKTIIDVRTRGQWNGGIVLIVIDFVPNKNFVDFYNISIVKFPIIDKTNLINRIGKRFTNSDGREMNKLNQWEKLHVFDDYFMKWDRVIYIDAGLRVLDSLKYLLNLDYKNKILAPNDGAPYKNPDKIFRSQISFDNMENVEKLKNDFGDILNSEYFLNCIWVYDTSILKICNKKQLIDTMNEYPLCKTNEMTVMNLLFNFKYKLWQEFPIVNKNGKYLFEWCETNHKHYTTWRDYCYIKYPCTITFEDT
jgi:hypothetical protein